MKTTQRHVELDIISSVDGTPQPSLFYFPEGKTNVPLVTALHTWSMDRFNQLKCYLGLCAERGWALLLPEFRGPNLDRNPDGFAACGSETARRDIVDAVEHIAANYAVRRGAFFLCGGSGGGHMALMAAAHAPDLWRAVAAWCPITDLREWHRYYGAGNSYAKHMEACLGGAPDDSEELARVYLERSPVNYLEQLARTTLSVHHGRFDKSVPYRMTLDFCNRLDALAPANFFFDIFDGGHEAYPAATLDWFGRVMNSGGETALSG